MKSLVEAVESVIADYQARRISRDHALRRIEKETNGGLTGERAKRYLDLQLGTFTREHLQELRDDYKSLVDWYDIVTQHPQHS